MAMREFKKDLNKGNDLLSINKTDKSFVNKKEVKSFYRIKNGKRIEYIEKSHLEEIEKMMFENKMNTEIGIIDIEDVKDTILNKLYYMTNNSLRKYKEYIKLSTIAKKLNLNDIHESLYCNAIASKSIAHKDINMHQLLLENVKKSEDELEELLNFKVKEQEGLLRDLVTGLGDSIPEEISSFYDYKKCAKLAEDAQFKEITNTCSQICETKKIIIEDLSITLNKLLETIEEQKLKIKIIQMSEKSKANPPV